ncbi:putative HAUS augmin-like complex subunit 1 [Paratrimastix pyriformis]|uniref:HAUS augmin-like complex subunit 1 n=1 Tax=Paratrimastix pyriformis TaxID=342808 RepID=A0ABQ8UFT0_9EUKA|nr:putative HAUS augmin-like complex subunit 1 [Paratrimastix pyriformis]
METRLRIDDLKLKTIEYEAEANRLQQILQGVGITPDILSPAGQETLETLASLAVQLEIQRPTEACYCAALNDLDERAYAEMRQLQKMQQEDRKRVLDITSLSARLEELRRILEECEAESKIQEDQEATWKRETEHHKNKAADYDRVVEETQHELEARGYDPAGPLTHRSITGLSEDVTQAKRELEQMSQTLQTYCRLPPDVRLARAEVDRLQARLEELDAILQERVAQVVECTMRLPTIVVAVASDEATCQWRMRTRGLGKNHVFLQPILLVLHDPMLTLERLT